MTAAGAFDQLRADLRKLTTAIDNLEAELRAEAAAKVQAEAAATSAVPLLTVSEAADAINVSRHTLYRLFASGELAWVQIGAHRRVAATEIDRFVDAHTEVAS